MNLPPDVAALLDAAAKRHNIPAEVARAVAWVESRGNQDSRSSAGAIGVMQLMPDTAKALGVDPHNAAQNIEGGVRFLANQWKRFGQLRKALAAYNWGPGRVASGRPLPQQVKTYIDRVLARAADELKGASSAQASTGPQLPPSSPPPGAPRAPEAPASAGPFVGQGSPSSPSAQPSEQPSRFDRALADLHNRLQNVEAFAVSQAEQIEALTARVETLERAFDEPIPDVAAPVADVVEPAGTVAAVAPTMNPLAPAAEPPAS